MTYVMEACAAFNKPLIILDRPNPTGGGFSMCEGPMLDEINCSSFIGRWSIPIRHCCTSGELATYFASTKIRNLELKILPVANWLRNQTADAWGYNFTPTSPAIKDLTIAKLYPGMGLLEGIHVNEGRGTEKPFQVFGAPWINKNELQELFISKNLPGVISKPIMYTPDDSLYKGKVCHGLELIISDENLFRPVKTALSLLQCFFTLYPEQIKERLYCTNANPSGNGHLDKLVGIKNAFDNIKTGNLPDTDVASSWPSEIRQYLIYS